MTKFYEIATVAGTNTIINLSHITEISELEREGEPAMRLVMANNSVKDVLKHSLMLALHHSETPYMLMGPGEAAETPPLAEVTTDDIVEVADEAK